jgi:hypothetical protein
MTTTFKFAIDDFSARSGSFLSHTDTAGREESAIVKLLQSIPAWNFDDWETLRKAFVASKPDDMSTDAAGKHWKKIVEAAGMTKPKSGKIDSQVKQTQRVKQSEKMEALLAMELPKLEKIKNTAVRDADFAQAGLVQKALDKKANELLKPQAEEFKAEVRKVREALNKLKVTDKATLDKIAKLLKV